MRNGEIIDLRSDTVTVPTDDMRAAMATADVGDDVYGDDPTVNKLQRLAAELLGKEAALFVPSGTMGNQLAIMAHTKRGDDVLCLRHGHVYQHEAGAAGLISGVTLNLVDSEDGILHPAHIAAQMRDPDDIHCPPTTLVCVENALAVGRAVPLADCKETYEAAKARGLAVHMDGARIFNAATALGVAARDIAQYADSVMFCLSKGLCAPAGSMLVGSADFIERALRGRKILGGAMRQAGILAAAGILALDTMTKRLGADHENAAVMADKLAAIEQVEVVRGGIPINMVFFKISMPRAFLDALPARLQQKGILINAEELGEFRFVTHNDVTADDVAFAVDALAAEIAKG